MIEDQKKLRQANNLFKQINLIKFTKLVKLIDQDSLFSFGAKLVEAKWKVANGVTQETSVMKILKFKQEKLDAYIAKSFKERYQFS